MGRPPKSDAEKLTEIMHFRVTKEVRERFDEKYKQSNLSMSEFLRKLLDERKENVTIVARPKMTGDKRRLLFLANKISNNINQLAHKVNSHHLSGLINDKTYEDVLRSLVITNKIMSGFINGVD